jgi:hypothetical protein
MWTARENMDFGGHEVLGYSGDDLAVHRSLNNKHSSRSKCSW